MPVDDLDIFSIEPNEFGYYDVKTKPAPTKDSAGRPFDFSSPLAEIPIEKTGPKHNRSREDSRTAKTVLYADEFGTRFGNRNIKGLPVQSPYVTFDPCGYMLLRVEGYKDNVGVSRMARASKFLRSHGLETERIVSIHEITEIDFGDGNSLLVEGWKKRLIGKAHEVAKSANLSVDLRNAMGHPTPYINTDQVRDYLAKLKLYAVDRDLQTPDRLQDIYLSMKEEGNRGYLSRLKGIFKWINVAETTTSPDRRYPDFQPFDSNSDADIARYSLYYLPDKMGDFLGKMHTLGLAHRYPHEQNWSAFGTLYDSDSIHGTPMGDEPITLADEIEDINKTITALTLLTNGCGYKMDHVLEAYKRFFDKYLSHHPNPDKVKALLASEKYLTEIPPYLRRDLLIILSQHRPS